MNGFSLAARAALVISLTLVGCGDEAAKSTPSVTSANANKSGAPAAPAGAGGLKWTTPSGFTADSAQKPMRLATFTFPKVEGDKDDAELTVTQVGGDKDSNVARWKGQFAGGDPATEMRDETVGDLKVTFISMQGTFMGGVGMGAVPQSKSGYTMLVAMVEWPGHGNPYFFKLVGPDATVEKAKPAYEAMVRGLTH